MFFVVVVVEHDAGGIGFATEFTGAVVAFIFVEPSGDVFASLFFDVDAVFAVFVVPALLGREVLPGGVVGYGDVGGFGLMG